MANSPITLSGILSALVVAVAMTALSAQPADAQAAKKLKCKGCVKSKQVKNDNLKALDLADEAGANFEGGDQSFPLSGTDQTVRTFTLVAPRSGVVIVNASGTFLFQAGSQEALCSISTTTANDPAAEVRVENDTLISWLPFASTRAFEVPAGSFTVYLVCREVAGNATIVRDSNLVALYVPTRY